MEKDFKIDFDKKLIEHSTNASGNTYSVQELYSFLQDIFDEPEYMRYDVPIEATGENGFKLINGWEISDEARKHLEGKLL